MPASQRKQRKRGSLAHLFHTGLPHYDQPSSFSPSHASIRSLGTSETHDQRHAALLWPSPAVCAPLEPPTNPEPACCPRRAAVAAGLQPRRCWAPHGGPLPGLSNQPSSRRGWRGSKAPAGGARGRPEARRQPGAPVGPLLPAAGAAGAQAGEPRAGAGGQGGDPLHKVLVVPKRCCMLAARVQLQGGLDWGLGLGPCALACIWLCLVAAGGTSLTASAPPAPLRQRPPPPRRQQAAARQGRGRRPHPQRPQPRGTGMWGKAATSSCEASAGAARAPTRRGCGVT